MTLDHRSVDRWLEAYVAAWKSYDAAEIGELFSAEVSYRFHPYDEPVVGHESVVAAWRGEGDHLDSPGGTPETVYENCFLIRFDDDGRCREFTEWFMERPRP